MEVMHGFAAAYQLSQDSTIKTYGDFIYGRTFGALGGIYADQNYLGAYLANNAFDFTTDKAKTLGFGFGWGLGASWPAVRSNTTPPLARSVGIPFSLAGIPNATQYRVTVTKPDRTQTQVVCTTSPCQVTLDARQGDHLVTGTYLTASGTTLSPAVPPAMVASR